MWRCNPFIRLAILIVMGVGAASPVVGQPLVGGEDRGRPNIVLILVDDAALMDFGAYGGEARTPNIDALARRGALFTNYRSSPLCAPSRAMLLTGVDNHLNGLATIPEVLPKEHVGQPGYSMRLEPGVLTLADRLKPLGYRTLMTGKWHLGSGAGDLPSDHGFDRSFALDASGADNWEDKSYLPFYREAPWYEDGNAAALPDDFYSSEFLVDKMIEYLEEGEETQPFLAYLAFQAIHIPVQAPADLVASYDGVYDSGWHALREARWERAKRLGLAPSDGAFNPVPEALRSWDALSEAEQKLYAARMQVNAAMLEAMDQHIGRLVAHLRAEGAYDNTLFIVTSDNGPEPSRADDDPRLAFWMGLNGYHVDLEGIGERGSYGFIGPEWANAAAAPSDLFKFYASEGGLRVPLIVAGPGVQPDARIDAFTLVTDVAPTVLDIVDAAGPPEDAVPMTGRSLVSLLTGAADFVYGPDEPVGFETSGNSALFRGDHKIVRNLAPYGDGVWRMFNVAADPGETRDLAQQAPELFASLRADYDAYAARVGVLEMPAGYDSQKQIARNAVAKQLEFYWWVLLILAVVLLAVLWGVWRVVRWTFGRFAG